MSLRHAVKKQNKTLQMNIPFLLNQKECTKKSNCFLYCVNFIGRVRYNHQPNQILNNTIQIFLEGQKNHQLEVSELHEKAKKNTSIHIQQVAVKVIS
jgi:hypothetical protein